MSLLCAAGAMECSNDLLTCGECRLVFSLSDIVSFIRHKQSTCRRCDDHSDEDEDTARRADSCPAGKDVDAADVTGQHIKTEYICTSADERTTPDDLHQDNHTSRPGSAFYTGCISSLEQ